ncbi:hypothetical protein XAC2852_790119 [Xanthomonas citri pv. citri]|nr:hypothetical protein XAC9322_700116 [Xanthomonas citri pv. citri]CEE38963.1 hypothetical protein XAC1083_720117 [Xanthomonas citri pv. citri]CEE80188.1 hypothetical protein XAC2852_790119 [Xanthomonas citri pv. citri]CEI35607.1 hypothetical protein XACJJ10_1640033 [Xanthomonas citri pv. citri]
MVRILSHPATFPSTVQSSPWLEQPADDRGSDAVRIRDSTKALAKADRFVRLLWLPSR